MMVRSLRIRLLLAMTAVLIAAVAAAVLISGMAAKREFDRFLIKQGPGRESMSARRVEEHYRNTGSWAGVAGVLAEIQRQEGRQSILYDAAGRRIAVWPSTLDRYDITVSPDGRITLTAQEGRKRAVMVLQGAGYLLRQRDGSGAGRLFLIPEPDRLPGLRRSFRGSVDRWLVVSIAVAIGGALLITFTILRRVLGPVDALTGGVRALADGRLDTRVDVRGSDEVAELGRTFNAMASALERNERARRNMVSDVAHELRTPLTNIRCQIEAAEDGLMQADDTFLASLAAETGALSRLVDDLQQLSLAEAGQLRLELADVDVGSLIARAIEPLQARLDGKSIATSGGEGVVIRADAGRMAQVLRNLLGNALVHAASAIVVSTEVRDGEVEIAVSDDGPGVPDDEAERVFDRFTRADASRSRATGGAGLGLAIARELVALHGGTIGVSRSALGGARFWVRLPQS